MSYNGIFFSSITVFPKIIFEALLRLSLNLRNLAIAVSLERPESTHQGNCYDLCNVGTRSLIIHDIKPVVYNKIKGVREFLLLSIKSIFLAKEKNMLHFKAAAQSCLTTNIGKKTTTQEPRSQNKI